MELNTELFDFNDYIRFVDFIYTIHTHCITSLRIVETSPKINQSRFVCSWQLIMSSNRLCQILVQTLLITLYM